MWKMKRTNVPSRMNKQLADGCELDKPTVAEHIRIEMQAVENMSKVEHAAAAAARCRRKFISDQLDEENPFVLISSVLLVQPDEGVSVLVVDRIGDNLPQSTEKSRVLVIPVGSRHKCQQVWKNENRKRPPGRRRVRLRPINHAHMSARFIARAAHIVAADARWWPHSWTLQAQIVVPLVETCAPLTPLLHVAAGRRRTRLSRVLHDGWQLDVARGGRGWAALSEMARRWAADARCWSATLAAAGRARCALAAQRCARRRAPPCENFSLAPAAAPASLRRCRDGWSEFF
ncbi:hypothetical protein F511_09997 [Dorcoceras hygrometricum]|uniref:Uncharacterized protein n=1 Tax=Dorcoceras hygrometricum TaxID=472368 RepID=A0A2Z7AJB6_9LAMI|nr:hypothetical protein F511_09997 [Dorcoceras hygrometricum]